MRWRDWSVRHEAGHTRSGKIRRALNNATEPVTRSVGEDTDKDLRQQEETIRKSRDAFHQEAERGAGMGAQFKGNLQSDDGMSPKPDGQAGQPPVPGNMQGGSTSQGVIKNPTSPR